MSDKSADQRPAASLTPEEEAAVVDRKSGSAKVVHEVIRLQGDEELDRSLQSLLFSGFAAGLAITASLLAETFLRLRLPDEPWAELVIALGYTVGYVIAIMGNLQLFTETTVTAVLPLATSPSWSNLGRLARLWAAVLAANLAGTLLVAVLIARGVILSPGELAGAVAFSAKLLEHDAGKTLLLGLPSGFLIGSVAWILPNARGSEFWIIVMVTYVIAISGMSHVVAGSTEAWLLWLTGKASLGWALGGFIGPALVGNIIGGTGLFAVLAHGQVRDEIDRSG